MQKKAVSCELLRKDMKKPMRVVLIEDPANFIVAEVEPDSKNCRVLLVVNWISVTFEMSREDATRLEASVADRDMKDSFVLIFDDQVRSNNVLASFNEVKWGRYEQ